MGEDRGRRTIVLAAIVLAAVLPYLNALTAEFTFDDFGLVVENTDLPPDTPVRVLLTSGMPGGVYRPLPMLTYRANAAASAGPFGYHLVNVGLHAVATVLVFALASVVLGGGLAAAICAAFFAVHPIHTEAVTSIAGRPEVLATVFVLGALLAFAAGKRRPGARSWWLGLSLALFAAGLLSKENAFTTVLLVALLEVWLTPRATVGRLVRMLVPYVAVGAGYLAFRVWLFGTLTQPLPPPVIDNPLAHVSFWPRIGTALVVLRQYLAALAMPLRLTADDSLAQIPVVTSIGDSRLAVAVVVLAGVAVALVVTRRRAPALAFAALFTAGALAVTANVLFPIGAMKAERFLYLPSVGWCLACGWIAARWIATSDWRRALPIGLVLVALAGRTWLRNRDWQTNFTLFTVDVVTSPESARANANAGAVYGRAGKLVTATFHYRRALHIFPRYATAAEGLAQAYEGRHHDAAALHWYARAAALDPDLVSARMRRAELLLRRGEPARAEVALRAVLGRRPDDPRLLADLALARLAQRDPTGARTLVAQAESQGGPNAFTADLRRRLAESEPSR